MISFKSTLLRTAEAKAGVPEAKQNQDEELSYCIKGVRESRQTHANVIA
jgi:hypothetical protein